MFSQLFHVVFNAVQGNSESRSKFLFGNAPIFPHKQQDALIGFEGSFGGSTPDSERSAFIFRCSASRYLSGLFEEPFRAFLRVVREHPLKIP